MYINPSGAGETTGSKTKRVLPPTKANRTRITHKYDVAMLILA